MTDISIGKQMKDEISEVEDTFLKVKEEIDYNYLSENDVPAFTDPSWPIKKCNDIDLDEPEYIDIRTLGQDIDGVSCHQCSLSFQEREVLNIHQLIHESSKHCPMCDEYFQTKRKFERHINAHVREKINLTKGHGKKCPYCEKVFSGPYKLEIHIRVHTNERPFVCNICAKSFKQRGNLNEHMNSHKNEVEICETCNGSFSTRSSLKRHIKRIHEKGKSFTCKYCNVRFLNRTDFNSHRSEVHIEAVSRRKCRYCNMAFSSHSLYSKHLATHKHTLKDKGIDIADKIIATPLAIKPKAKAKTESVLKCSLCNEQFSTRMLYDLHLNEHILYSREDVLEARRKGYFSCRQCFRKFKYKYHLLLHSSCHMEKELKCTECDAETRFSLFGMKCHRNQYHRLFTCRVCHQEIKGYENLRYHNRLQHPQDFAYICAICSAGFITRNGLKVHILKEHDKTIKTHKHMCDVCGKKFPSPWLLSSHRLNNTCVKIKRECKYCHRLFTNIHLLKRHLVTIHSDHTKINFCPKTSSYICDICHKTTKHAYSFKRHMASHKKVKKLQCKKCLKIFRLKQNYNDHVENDVCGKMLENSVCCKYKCHLCINSYNIKEHFMSHLLTHSIDYRTCRFCKIQFDTDKLVEAHMEEHHAKEQPFYCNYCQLGFSIQERFCQHVLYSKEHINKCGFEETTKNSNHFETVDIKIEPADVKKEKEGF